MNSSDSAAVSLSVLLHVLLCKKTLIVRVITIDIFCKASKTDQTLMLDYKAAQ